MAKNNPATKKSLLPGFSLFPFKNGKQPYIVLAVIGFILYINTIYNEFALDDGIIIHKNEFVMKGSAGIKDILTHDAYYSFYRQMNAEDQLAGGRYRPLSVVSFAIEQNFIKTYKDGKTNSGSWDVNKNNRQDPEEDVNGDGLFNETDALVKGCGLRHFNNMLFYVLSVLLLFSFLRNYIFTSNPDLAFLSALIFCIHPLHTEVVANMKSRDEIFSFIFIILTFIYVLKTVGTGSLKHLILSGLMYLLALLSKEYALTLLALVPLMIIIFRPGTIDVKNKNLWILTGLFFVSAFTMYYFEAHDKGYFKIIPLFFTVLIPFLFQKDFKSRNFVAIMSVMCIAFLIYLAMRFHATVLKPKAAEIAEEILNDPYLLIKNSPMQIYATKIFVLLKYITLLFYPFSLSSDYSYNTIEYRTFASWDTLLSILIHVSLIVLTVILFLRKHPLSFALIFYFANLFMIGNIVFDIGATMGERLIFHSSLGFAICIAWLMTDGLKKINVQAALQRNVVLGFSVILIVLFGYKTIARNAEWKNDITLFTTDVNTVPNSVLCLGNAGARWIDLSEKPENKAHEKEYLDKAIGYLNHALELHPKYVNGYLNLGLAYLKLKDYNKAEEIWGKAKALYPNNPYLATYYQYLAAAYMGISAEQGQAGKLPEAIKTMEKAARVNPSDPEIWYNLGGAAFTMKDYDKARIYFEKCLQLNPNHQQAKLGYASLPK
ncbi:MAG: tetratricopeptide repeat protein [Bacteroidia bacterium]